MKNALGAARCNFSGHQKKRRNRDAQPVRAEITARRLAAMAVVAAISLTGPLLQVSDTLQQAWTLLKQGGFNLIRFPINPAEAQTATRLANLCVWAKTNGVLLVSVLDLDAAKTSPSPCHEAAQRERRAVRNLILRASQA